MGPSLSFWWRDRFNPRRAGATLRVRVDGTRHPVLDDITKYFTTRSLSLEIKRKACKNCKEAAKRDKKFALSNNMDTGLTAMRLSTWVWISYCLGEL